MGPLFEALIFKLRSAHLKIVDSDTAISFVNSSWLTDTSSILPFEFTAEGLIATYLDASTTLAHPEQVFSLEPRKCETSALSLIAVTEHICQHMFSASTMAPPLIEMSQTLVDSFRVDKNDESVRDCYRENSPTMLTSKFVEVFNNVRKGNEFIEIEYADHPWLRRLVILLLTNPNITEKTVEYISNDLHHHLFAEDIQASKLTDSELLMKGYCHLQKLEKKLQERTEQI